MQLHNLQATPIEAIANCFNKAFEHYFVPIKLEPQQLADKIKSQNILLEHSVGVTIDNQLVGFILIGIDFGKSIAYNAGTGMIPEFRGQKLTEKMYAYLLPQLDGIGIKNQLLEVICENHKALKIYENLRYSTTRKVICYKGKIRETKNKHQTIREIDLPDENQISQFWNHNPTYQNSMFCIKNITEKHRAFGAFENEQLIGYIIFDKDSLMVKQFGVDKAFREKGIGHSLFNKIQQLKPEAAIVLINIDANDLETNTFLQSIGFEKFIEQFEMQLNPMKA